MTNNINMPNCNNIWPFAATTVRFMAYVVKADFEYRPDSDAPVKKHLIHSRYESSNLFFARTSAVREIRWIKGLLDKGLLNTDAKYNYEGISLWMEYQISQPCSDTFPEIKKLNLLNGEIGTRDDILQRISNEEFLLDVMGFSFVRGIIDCKDGQAYCEMVEELFDGLLEIDADFIQKNNVVCSYIIPK